MKYLRNAGKMMKWLIAALQFDKIWTKSLVFPEKKNNFPRMSDCFEKYNAAMQQNSAKLAKQR